MKISGLTALLIVTLVAVPVAGRLCLLACDSEPEQASGEPAPAAHCPAHEETTDASPDSSRRDRAPCREHGHAQGECVLVFAKETERPGERRLASPSLLVLPAASVSGAAVSTTTLDERAGSPRRGRPASSAVLRL